MHESSQRAAGSFTDPCSIGGQITDAQLRGCRRCTMYQPKLDVAVRHAERRQDNLILAPATNTNNFTRSELEMRGGTCTPFNTGDHNEPERSNSRVQWQQSTVGHLWRTGVLIHLSFSR